MTDPIVYGVVIALAPVYLVALVCAFKIAVTLLGIGKELQES